MNEIESKFNKHCDYVLYIDRVSLPTKAPTAGRPSEETSFQECENYSIPMLIAVTITCFFIVTGLVCIRLYLKHRKSTIRTCPNTTELNEAPQ